MLADGLGSPWGKHFRGERLWRGGVCAAQFVQFVQRPTCLPNAFSAKHLFYNNWHGRCKVTVSLSLFGTHVFATLLYVYTV